jgi:hypothetical protein
VDLSEANPLVTRAYAFYMIGTCEAPIALNRERASTLFKDAARKDETNSRFDIAYYIYRYAVNIRTKNLAFLEILHALKLYSITFLDSYLAIIKNFLMVLLLHLCTAF